MFHMIYIYIYIYICKFGSDMFVVGFLCYRYKQRFLLFLKLYNSARKTTLIRDITTLISYSHIVIIFENYFRMRSDLCIFLHRARHISLSVKTHFFKRFLARYYTACPTRYRTRDFFNNCTTNEDIATKFEADYRHIRLHFSHNECTPFQISLQ